ncbi:hypothetical protein ACFW5V_32185 [Streptomyces sp. NPDC058762]|uniref:hypothetical protein n=1 Tax=Streptomyces sp. NPDC058762 TaxID=3346629 RepID=UPI0036BB1F2E
MTTTRTQPAAGSDLSDRAFRVLFQLSLYEPGEWVDVPCLAAGLKTKPYAIRLALAELCAAGVAERDRRYVRARGQRPTSRTYFRATETSTNTSEAPA